MKRYSRTAQLIYGKIENCAISSTGVLENSSSNDMFLAQIESGKTYSINTAAYVGFFMSEPVKGNTSYDNQRTLIQEPFTAPITGYIAIRLSHSSSDLMFNEGSTSLPYAPYIDWQTKSPPKYGTATETIQSGDTIYANGQPISTYSLKGNTTQSGTPTPSNPVDVQGVGNKTANLSPNNTFTNTTTDTRSYLSLAFQAYSDSGFLNQNLTNVTESKRAIVTLTAVSGTTRLTVVHNGATQNIRIVPYFSAEAGKYTLVADVTGYNPTVEGGIVLSNIMILSGEYTLETIPPYEPYGFKIPISSGGVTTNIYLNEPLFKINDTVDTEVSSGTATYAIKKYEITGQEYWTDVGVPRADTYLYMFSPSGIIDVGNVAEVDVVCTHFVCGSYYSGNTEGLQHSQARLYFRTTETTLENWKTWLSGQYAAGTPVTVWYILTTPTTEIITAPSIPTSDGENSITVDTTVQPSEFTATWTGWHDSSVKEYDGTDWQ